MPAFKHEKVGIQFFTILIVERTLKINLFGRREHLSILVLKDELRPW